MCAGSGQEEGGESERSRWQEESGVAEEVLYCVFCQLTGAALARAATVCHAWRRAASTPALWRHLLLRECDACPLAVRDLVELEAAEDSGARLKGQPWSWRDEYVRTAAGWHERRKWLGAECAVLEHATLDTSERALAIAADDACISVWDFAEDFEAWSMRWRMPLGRRRGWFSAARVEWSTDGERLLAAGALVLSARWELIVLDASEGRVLARAACSAGGAGCWAGDDAFLSLELRLAAPSHATTSIWLNAATQETQSEHTGVAAPLLRIYNEAHAAISHVTVVDVLQQGATQSVDGNPGSDDMKMLVGACGAAGGQRGVASALCAWRLPLSLAPPRVCAAAGGDLRARLARHRAAALAAQEQEEKDPAEEVVRGQCTPPLYTCSLGARVLGLVVNQTGGSVWVQVSGGHMVNVSLPALEVQRLVTTPGVSPSLVPNYVQPAVSHHLLAAPQSDGSVSVWTLPCAARAQSVSPAPSASNYASPALAVLAPRASRYLLLVLVGRYIHVWESRATIQQQL